MKTFIVLFFSVLFFVPLSAQQLPLFTQYREHHSLINPASINSDFFLYEHNFSAGASWRKQWGKIGEGAPLTYTGKMEYIYNKNRVLPLVFGVNFISDQIGPIQTSGFYGRIGGLLLTSEPSDGALIIGLSAGLVSQRIQWDKVKFSDPSSIIIPDDMANNRSFVDFGVGIFWYKYIYQGWLEGDNIYAGLSIPQTFEPESVYTDKITLKRVRHYYLQLGWYKYLNEDSYLEPSAWLKFVPGLGLHVDANIRYHFSDYVFVGAGFSTAKMLNLEFGLLVGEWLWPDTNMKLGYSFSNSYNRRSAPIGLISPYFGLTHEINVAFTIDTVGKY